ncbi:neuronal acetylcholine receptor subunit alpha-5-like [Anopheles marshallii]|uniref:neuronal acetylcholine receptor subunit alpha-5-like n=1 Tax=Anopheles marshallii TaxID=1521116 RepID=UPI00237AF4F2|nr:neuronal acetylcholine receptor subunit alpha-5-like [Anopheles marshallii]
MGVVSSLILSLLTLALLLKPATPILCNKTTGNVENALKQHLFCNGYDPKIRPAKSDFDTINITVTSYLFKFDVIEYSKTLHVEMIYEMMWQDTTLQWNASDWSNITFLLPNNDEIWIPRFEHVNSDYEGESSLSCNNPHCVLYDTGKLVCVPTCLLDAKCSYDYSRWPYNTMGCQTWFSNHDQELVDEINFLPFETFVAKGADPASAKWCITSFTSSATMLNIPGATRRNVKALKFELEHTPHVVLVALYFPGFGLVMLNIFICWLHSLASEKRKIILISLLCHFQLVCDISVRFTEVPGAVMFGIASMILTLLLFVITLILRWMHDLHTTPPRILIRWMRSLTSNRMMELFVQTEYLSLGHKPSDFTSYVELRDWPTIVKFTDRCVFVLYVFIYLLLFWIYVPMQHVKHDSNDPYALCAS